MSQHGSARPNHVSRAPSGLSRRELLAGGGALAALGALAACAPSSTPTPKAGPAATIGPHSDAVLRADAGRRRPGAPVHEVSLTAQQAHIDLGGPMVTTWTFGDGLPGPLLRCTAGDSLRVHLTNQLPATTTVHWHGLVVRNDMDGVPGVTQNAVPQGATFTYDFALPNAGTYWYHSHVGVQRDRGLYGALIVDDPREPGGYDADWIVVLDDWIDGTGRTPDQVLTVLQAGGMGGMGGGTTGTTSVAPTTSAGLSTGGMGTGMSNGSMTGGAAGSGGSGMSGMASSLLGGDAGDVNYPYYLLNGRVPTAPAVFTAKPRQKARIRLINVGGDTAFRVALGGHQFTVTHTDGYPVDPVTVDCLLVGMGERYDVEVTLDDGAFPLVAVAEGKAGQALAVVRTGTGRAPTATVRPAQLSGRLLTYTDLRATDSVALPRYEPDRAHDLVLAGNMRAYQWTINGRAYPNTPPLVVRQGEHVRLRYVNTSTMYHPMHLHGHTFQLRQQNGTGPRKDTVNVLPGQTVVTDLVADNPGQWVTHCHNAYHEMAGMMAVLSYQR